MPNKSIKDLNRELTNLKEANKKKKLQEQINQERRKLKGPSKLKKVGRALGSLDLSAFDPTAG